MPPHLLVERALALIPGSEEFLPLSDAVIGTSRPDGEKQWARSGAYTTLGKRVVDPARLEELAPRIAERARERIEALFTLVLQAIREQEAGEPAAAAETLVRAGEMEEEERRLEKAEGIYRMALEIAADLRDKGPQVLALRRLGRVARAAGRLDEAWSWYHRSWQLSVDQMDRAGQIVACQGLGNVCDDRGEREAAREWYERGLALVRDTDDPRLVWPFHANLSIVALFRGELDRAEALLARARALIEATGDPRLMPFWYNNRGLLLLESGRVDEAERTFREGLACEEEPRWRLSLGINLGESLLRQERLFEAEEEARRAEELGIVHRLVPYLPDVYRLFGRIARARCDEEGFVFYEQALEVCRERGLPEVREAAVYHEYGLLYAACGRPAEAAAYLDRARQVYARLGLTAELERVRRELEGVDAPT